MEEQVKNLYKCVQDRYAKVVWTHKIQEIQGDILSTKSKRVSNHICWFTVLTTGGAVATIASSLGDIPFEEIVRNIAGVITAVLAAGLSYFNLRYGDGRLEKRSNENKLYAAKLHDLRNKYESLMVDIKSGLLTEEEIVKRREILEVAENELYSAPAPSTTKKAVKKAGTALKQGRESTTEDEEINSIVPEYLRLI